MPRSDFSEQHDVHLRDIIGGLRVGDFQDEVVADHYRAVGGNVEPAERGLGNVQCAVAAAGIGFSRCDAF